MINYKLSDKLIKNILIVNSIILFIINRSELLFIFSVILGSVLYIFMLYKLFTKLEYIKFTNLLVVGLLGGYSLGTANFILSNIVSDISFSTEVLDNLFGGYYTFASLSLALSIVYFTSGILLYFSPKENPIFQNLSLQLIQSKNNNILYYLCIGISFSALLLGKFQIQATISEEETVSIFNQVAQFITPVTIPLLILKYKNSSARNVKIIQIFTIATLLIETLIMGRRVLIFTIFCIIISLCIKSSGHLYITTKNRIRNILILTIALIAISVGFNFLHAARLSSSIIQEKLSFIDQIIGGFELVKDDSSFVSESLKENSNHRTFILSYLATIIEAQNDFKPLFGDELIYSIKMGIPSILYPSKVYTLPSASETFTHPSLGIPLFDGPNTLVTSGVTDFALIGSILYSLIFIFLNIKILQLTKSLPAFIVYFIKFRLVYMTLSIEQAFYSFISTGPRDLIAISLVFFLILIIQAKTSTVK